MGIHMKMFKTLVATSILASVPAAAIADPVVYGKANLTVQSSDDGTDSTTEIKSNASRLGIKGSQKLDNGLEMVYQYEVQVDVSDESKELNLTSRSQFIGIRGSFGEVLLGRNDTVLKQSQGKVDVFSDLEGDLKVLWKGENRMNDSITYKSPKFNNFQVGVSYILDEDNDDSSTSLSLAYGDSALKKGKFYAAVAMDNEVKGYDATRITFSTKVSDVIVGAMFQTQENVATGEDKSGYLVSAQYKLGEYNLKGQFQTLEDDNGFTVGVDRKLAKNSKVFAFYTTYNFDMSEDETYLGLGLEQKF